MVKFWRKMFGIPEEYYYRTLGEPRATIKPEPLLSVNDLAAIDHAQERHNRLLLECYRSGQISEAQWQMHLNEDPGLAEYVYDALSPSDRAEMKRIIAVDEREIRARQKRGGTARKTANGPKTKPVTARRRKNPKTKSISAARARS